MTKRNFLISGLILLFVFSLFGQLEPHMVIGSVRNSDGPHPDPECVTFQAWMTDRPGEILTQDSDGCAVEDTLWFVNVGNFATAPADGEELTIFFQDTCAAETLTVTGNIELPGPEEFWGTYELVPEYFDPELELVEPDGGDHYFWDDPIDIL